MSVFNGERFLTPAIESILNQTYKNFEFIIVDDASTDNSFNILHKYALKDQRIILTKNKTNIGLTASLEKLTSQVRGEYLARMDADDISLPNRIESQVSKMEKEPQLGLIATWVCSILEDGNLFEIHKFPDSHDWIAKNLRKGINCIAHGSIMIRYSIIQSLETPIWRFKYGQDLDLYLRLLNITKMGFVKEILYYQRAVSSSMSIEVAGLIRSKLNKLILDLADNDRSIMIKSNWREIENTILIEKSKLRQLTDNPSSVDAMIFAKTIQGKSMEVRTLIKNKSKLSKLGFKDRFYFIISLFPSTIGAGLVKCIIKMKYRRDLRIKYTSWAKC